MTSTGPTLQRPPPLSRADFGSSNGTWRRPDRGPTTSCLQNGSERAGKGTTSEYQSYNNHRIHNEDSDIVRDVLFNWMCTCIVFVYTLFQHMSPACPTG